GFRSRRRRAGQRGCSCGPWPGPSPAPPQPAGRWRRPRPPIPSASSDGRRFPPACCAGGAGRPAGAGIWNGTMKPLDLHAPRRYLALFLPLITTDRLRRSAIRAGQKPADHPLVVVARKGNILALVGADAHARQKGLRPGLAFADARARVPQLEVVEHDEKADADLLERLADWCDRYSPFVATEPPDGIVCDITGVPHLFGGEAELVTDMKTRLQAQGFATRIAIAGTARAARALARFGKGGIVAPGTEAQALARLPVEALECGEKTSLGLRRAGLTTLADLAARPRKPLAARFGDDITAVLAQI